MNGVRVLVVDDEPLALRRLKHLLETCGCTVVGECRSVPHMLKLLEQGLQPDLLFLDVEMPGGSGLEVPPELSHPIPIVYVTAHMEHAARAFDLDAVDYLLKPVFLGRLQKALEKFTRLHPSPGAILEAKPKAARSPMRFPAKAAGGTFFLDFRRVSHFEFLDHAVVAWFGGQKFKVAWESLSEVEEAFPDRGLLRIQRHLLLRPEAVLSIRSLEGGRASVRLPEGIELEVSRSMTPRVREALRADRP